MITQEHYLYFVSRALEGMSDIVTELGDELANHTPPLPGANSPFALLTHCLGVVSFWAGGLVAGREITRDRDAEFTASGPVAPLVDHVRDAVAQLREDVAGATPRAALHGTPHIDVLGPSQTTDQGAALLHVYEELAQHYGQMEILRDCILAEFVPDRSERL
jgi:hypothetical protein